MKVLSLFVALLLASASPALAHGSGDFKVEGTIDVAAGGIASALFGVCTEEAPTQGFDAQSIRLPFHAVGHRFELTSSPSDTYLFFYDSSCSPIATFQRRGPERGWVPDGAAWAFVTGAGLDQDVAFVLVVEGAAD